RLSSNSLSESAAGPGAGLGVAPASRLSSNSTSSLDSCSSEMPLSAGSRRLMPLSPDPAGASSPSLTSSSSAGAAGISSLPSSSGDAAAGLSSMSLLESVGGLCWVALAGRPDLGGVLGVLGPASASDSSNGELVGSGGWAPLRLP